MSQDIDWIKLIGALSADVPTKRKRRAAIATGVPMFDDPNYFEKQWEEQERLRQQEKIRKQHEYAQKAAKLEADIIRLEQVDGELKQLEGKNDSDQLELVQLFYDKLMLLSNILRSGVDIPESKAGSYYATMQTMKQLALEKHLADAEAIIKIDQAMESAYAEYYRTQEEIHNARFEDALQNGHFTSNKDACDLAKQILACGRKALEQFKKMNESGMITVKVGSPYEVYNEGIIMDKSSDESFANVRVKTRDYYLYDILETLIRYSVICSQMEAAKQYEKVLNQLDLGFRIKGVSNRIDYETANWNKQKPKEEPSPIASNGSREPKHSDSPDFAWLVAVGIVVAAAVLFLVIVLK